MKIYWKELGKEIVKFNLLMFVVLFVLAIGVYVIDYIDHWYL